MPPISRFLDIIIRINFDDNIRHKAPHFHFICNDGALVINIEDLSILASTDTKVLRRFNHKIRKWCELHREELLKNWQLCSQHKPIEPIEPLK